VEVEEGDCGKEKDEERATGTTWDGGVTEGTQKAGVPDFLT